VRHFAKGKPRWNRRLLRAKLIVGQRRARTWKHRSGELLEVIEKQLHQRKFIAARLSVI